MKLPKPLLCSIHRGFDITDPRPLEVEDISVEEQRFAATGRFYNLGHMLVRTASMGKEMEVGDDGPHQEERLSATGASSRSASIVKASLSSPRKRVTTSLVRCEKLWKPLSSSE